jgi:hypothetical protein
VVHITGFSRSMIFVSNMSDDVRDLTYLTPQVGRIIYFHVIKVNINKA